MLHAAGRRPPAPCGRHKNSQLQFSVDRRPFDCLSKVIKVTLT